MNLLSFSEENDLVIEVTIKVAMVLQLLAMEPSLIRAIFACDGPEVRDILVTDSESINYVDSDKRSPLHAAAYRGDPGIVDTLITLGGARVNTKDNKWLTPLHRACAARVKHFLPL